VKILVTGGAGFVGSHACKALHRAGFEPIVYDNLSRGHADAVRWGALEIGDVRDIERMTSVMRTHGVGGVLHFAGLAYVGESFTQCDAYHSVNVAGAWSMLQAMRRAKVTRLVFSSSCSVYGDVGDAVCTEETDVAPVSPYGASKAAAEQLIRMQALASGLRWAVLRYFNAAGADPDGEIGEDHDPETHLIPRACAAAFDGEALEIFGDDYPTQDGGAERDYVHVSDLADAHVAALSRLIAGDGDLTLNLCSGIGVSTFQVCAAVERVLGRRLEIVRAPRRPGDPPRLVGDGARARDVLGWAPQRSDLDQMVADAAAWISRSRARPAPPAMAVDQATPRAHA
jgi:UDP-arabinose 4-epimerase